MTVKEQQLQQEIQKQQQEIKQLSDQAVYYRTLVEAIPLPFVISHVESGLILFANQPFAALTRFSPERLNNLLATELYDDPAERQKMVTALKKTGTLANYELQVKRSDGTFLWVSTFAKIFEMDGNSLMLTIIQDITSRRQAEADRQRLIAELEAKNEELEQFTYRVSHDLKSPLITIRSFLGLLERDLAKQDEERVGRDMERIHAAANHMVDLLDNLLALSRIGRLTGPLEEISFAQLVDEALEQVAGQLREHDIHIHIGPNLPMIYGDRARLVDVLQNLLDNAIKFMGQQTDPSIEIDADQQNDTVIYYVRDNGIGINPVYYEKIFGIFERLDASTPGTGLGLALVKRIVDVHNGRIWVESEGDGKGTTFYFTLPASPHSMYH
jgi:PAS domain S-box-containing protein